MNSTKNARKICLENNCDELLRSQTADVTLPGGLRLVQKSLVCPIHGTVTAKPVNYSTEEDWSPPLNSQKPEDNVPRIPKDGWTMADIADGAEIIPDEDYQD